MTRAPKPSGRELWIVLVESSSDPTHWYPDVMAMGRAECVARVKDLRKTWHLMRCWRTRIVRYAPAPTRRKKRS